MNESNPSKTAIISPSGKFYGSEQTLFSFLSATQVKYDVYVNRNDGQLYERLTKQGKHRVILFGDVKVLFVRLSFSLLTGQYSNLYFNEGGFIRYIKILSGIFRKRKFIVHIRLTEDAALNRIAGLRSNVILISVSQFISKIIMRNTGRSTTILSSPNRGGFAAGFEEEKRDVNSGDKIRIAVIGRVTESKGLREMDEFIAYTDQVRGHRLEFHFYGDVEMSKPAVSRFVEKVKAATNTTAYFHGYQSNKDKVFESSDIIVHFNKNEPLGVIFFEALNYGKPIVGFNSGGIGEIAENLELDDFMVEEESSWPAKMLTQIERAVESRSRFASGKDLMLRKYSVENYVQTLEEIIHG